MVTIDEIRPFVASNLSGMMRRNLDRCIQWAAYDFATQSGCQKEVVSGYHIASLNQVSFNSEKPKSEVFSVLSIEINGNTLRANDFTVSDGAATLNDSLDSDQACTVTLLSRPSLDATEFSDEIGIRYQQSIVNGALHRGHSMAGGEWYSPDLAEHKRQQYEAGISKAKQEAFQSTGGRLDYRRLI